MVELDLLRCEEDCSWLHREVSIARVTSCHTVVQEPAASS